MAYVPDSVVAVMRQGSFNLGIFLRLGTTPSLNLSFSVNDIPIALNGLDGPGTVYKGAGKFTNLPALEVLVNGKADKVSFTLSGVDPTAAAMMLDSAPEVLGALATVGMAPMDSAWQPTTAVIPLWTGVADYLSESMNSLQDPRKNRTQSISLTCYAGDTTRAYPGLQTNTSAYQKLAHPDDTFFDRVSRYLQTFLVSWPRY